MLRQNSNQGVDHGVGHGEAKQRRIDADAVGITFGNYGTVVNDSDGIGSPKRRAGGFFEGVVECGF